jgi:hypothetical protein
MGYARPKILTYFPLGRSAVGVREADDRSGRHPRRRYPVDSRRVATVGGGRVFMARVRMVRAAALVVALVASLVVVLPMPASAAGVALFSQTFANNAVTGGVGAVVKSAPPSGTNTACLTATGKTATGVLVSCPTSTSGSRG